MQKYTIYTNGSISLKSKWTPLYFSQQDGKAKLYTGADTKYGYKEFPLKKKTYRLGTVCDKPTEDVLLLESEIDSALSSLNWSTEQ